MNDYLRIIKDKSGTALWIIPFALTCAWTASALISIFVTGFRTVDIWLVCSILLKLAVIAVNLFFIDRLFIKGKTQLYGTFKTYAGYGTVLVYVVYAFPRFSWDMGGLLSGSEVFFLWMDSVISAAIPAILYLILWNFRTQVAWNLFTLEEYKERKTVKRAGPEKKRGFAGFVLENVNILVQAIIIVILIQHFVFQPYLIPTESMVPTFLKNDRPLVTKLQSGPAVPLTDMRLPVLVEPARGMIVVFERPTYVQNDLAKKMFQHFIFLATFSLVDIDPQVRFIVKRIIAEPGEKIMMIDDIVYLKKEGDADFAPLEKDAEYKHVDLYAEEEKVRRRIDDLVIDGSTRALFVEWDTLKNDATLDGLFDASMSLRDGILSGLSAQEARFLERSFSSAGSAFPGTSGALGELVPRVFRKYLGQDGKSIHRPKPVTDPYVLSCKKLNLMFQNLCLKKMRVALDLRRSGIGEAAIFASQEILSLNDELADFGAYMAHFDERNFPEFPQGDGIYIPDGEYFLMGDNRYNSLDFRYSDDVSLVRLDPDDAYSFTYFSRLYPHTLNENKILGIVALRMWPPDRFGVVK